MGAPLPFCSGSMGLPSWPDRSSHQDLATPCRLLLGPSQAWGPGSGAYTCRRTSCRPCPPCLVSASWSWLTSAAIPSSVTASCSHFTGEHSPPRSPSWGLTAALGQAPPSLQFTMSAQLSSFGGQSPARDYPSWGESACMGLGWNSQESLFHRAGMRPAQPVG